jgi:23S rRNA (guanosine2251-2'-O)-methyltransferase
MVRKKKQIKGELIYGINPLVELLKAKRRKLISIYTTKPVPKQWREIEEAMPTYPVQIQYVSRDVLTNMCGSNEHQGVVAWVQSFAFRKKSFDPEKQPFIVMLDSIQDPRNLGAILRSAYCTGAQGVVVTTKNSAPLNSVAIKSSAGLSEHLEKNRYLLHRKACRCFLSSDTVSTLLCLMEKMRPLNHTIRQFAS